MIKVFLLLALWFSTIFANYEIPRVKYVPPAYLDKVDVIAYESHSKLIFKVELPNFHTLLPKNNTCPEGLYRWKTECDTEAAIREIFTDYYTELLSFNESDDFSGRRTKRQIIPIIAGAGLTLLGDSVINMFSHALFGTETNIVQRVNQLRNSVKAVDQKYFLMEEKVTAFGRAMENYQQLMIKRIYDQIGYFKDEVSKQISKIYHLLLLKIDHDELMTSISQCRGKEFPVKLVSIKALMSSLKKMSDLQKQVGKKLAIPINKISNYFKLPIVDCYFSATHATVVVIVPLVKADSNWAVYRIIHYNFAYLSQTCSIYPQEASFLASSKNRNVLITSYMLSHCSVEEHKLCLIPQFETDSTQSLSCVVGILNNLPVHQLAKFCSFRCSSNVELSIKQLDNTRIIVTNAKTIEMQCPEMKKTYSVKKLGTVEILLDCNCTIIIDSKTKIDPFYCFTLPESSERVYTAIPTLWTKLDMAFGSNVHTFIDHSNLTMNYNWTQFIPTLNLTPSHVVVPDQLVENVFSVTNIWLTVLSLIVFTMFGMLVCMYITVVRR